MSFNLTVSVLLLDERASINHSESYVVVVGFLFFLMNLRLRD